MKICGIITEYNPFHNGHLHHIQEARKISSCDILIAVMSGNFVQRGEPAIIDKWQRAKCAVENGVDLLIELPFPYVVQSADHFAKGAIQTLQLAGIDSIVFGSESNNLEELKAISEIPFQLDNLPKENSLAKNFANQTQDFMSNDILGIAYLRAIKDTSIVPYTIQRTNEYLGEDLQQSISSATAIRKGVFEHLDVSHATAMAAQLNTAFTLEHYYPLIQTLLTTLSLDYLASLFLMDEGIEHQLVRNAKECTDLTSFLDKSTSRRYTRSKIQRTLIHLINQTRKSDINELEPLQHIRVLAFNEVGKQYLNLLRKKEHLIVASKFNQIPKALRNMELKASSVYSYPLSMQERKLFQGSELQPPIYIKS